jgi:hypothetical protein
MNHIPIVVRVVDLDKARLYLRSLAAMCAEAGESTDPPVVILALRVLERQLPQARALVGRL